MLEHRIAPAEILPGTMCNTWPVSARVETKRRDRDRIHRERERGSWVARKKETCLIQYVEIQGYWMRCTQAKICIEVLTATSPTLAFKFSICVDGMNLKAGMV